MIAILSVIILLVVVGFILWLIQFLPLDGTIKQIVLGIIIFLTVIYLIEMLLGGPAIFTLK
jgi:hypothetical protein